MSISVSCPHCQARIRADDKFVGREANCPKCGGKIVIQMATAASKPPPLPVKATPPVQPRPQPINQVPVAKVPVVKPASNKLPLKKRRVWQLLVVALSLVTTGVLIGEVFLPTQNYPNRSTIKASTAPAVATSEIDYRSEPTTTLTADYYPFQSGTQRKFTRMLIQGDGITGLIENVSIGTDGHAIETYDPKMMLFAAADHSRHQTVDCPLKPASELFRLTDGFVELDANPEGESLGWEPVLQIGAKKGDKWSRQYKGLSSFYQLVYLGGLRGYAVAGIWQLMKTSDGSPLGQHISWYVKGLGLVREDGGGFEHGQYHEAYKLYLLKPKLPFSVDDLPINQIDTSANPVTIATTKTDNTEKPPPDAETQARDAERESIARGGIVDWTDPYGSAISFSNKLIPVLHGVPDSVVKMMPADELTFIRSVESLGEEANRMSDEQDDNPLINERAKEKIRQKSLSFNHEQPQKLNGWIGWIALAPQGATINIGRRTLLSNEPYEYGVGSITNRPPPRATYVTAAKIEPLIAIHIETRYFSDAGIQQFAGMKDGDWVKLDIDQFRWQSTEIVAFKKDRSNKSKAIFAGMVDVSIGGIRPSRFSKKPITEPVVSKVASGE